MPAIGRSVPFSWAVAHGAMLICGVRTHGRAIRMARALSGGYTMVRRVSRRQLTFREYNRLCGYIEAPDFVPSTNHRAVAAHIHYKAPDGSSSTTFPPHRSSLNTARIKFPIRSDKQRHDNFRIEINAQLVPMDLYDAQVTVSK
ncbi:hypothetical protein B0H13DRAFT_2358866 [Mycena leptocephala]|nr:hypothetical protein B0H13DRAFT_2358866 [Mycena leptocephala]